ncbi:MAG: helix-turn-helix domain-containing protein [Desulfobacterales bacterium]|jgi:transcriptional regulator with XRE-family HTH domain
MESRQKEMLERIGARIRSERNNLGLSLEALAKKVGISKMTLQRIETGSTSPSIVVLTDISFHLKQPIETLIKEGEPRVVLLKKGGQDTIFDPESGIRVLAPKGLITDRLTLSYAELKEGDVIELHRNKGFEWAFLIEGNAVVRVGTKEYDVEEGDAIFYDAHFPHSIRVNRKIRYVGLFLQDE